MTDNTTWLTIEEVAKTMEATPQNIRYQLRWGVWRRFLKPDTQPPMVDPDLLTKAIWWATITGTNNRRNWPQGWTGHRLGDKQARKMLIAQARAAARKRRKTD